MGQLKSNDIPWNPTALGNQKPPAGNAVAVEEEELPGEKNFCLLKNSEGKTHLWDGECLYRVIMFDASSISVQKMNHTSTDGIQFVMVHGHATRVRLSKEHEALLKGKV